MKRNLASTLISILFAAFISCKKMAPSIFTSTTATDDGVSFLFDVKGWDCGSKSSIGFEDVPAINDVNMLVFVEEDGKFLFERSLSNYFSSFDKIRVGLNGEFNYKIYFIANAGRSVMNEAAGYGSLEKMQSKMRLLFPSYCSSFNENGMPMVSCCDLPAGTCGKKRVHFERLYSRWSIRIDDSGIELGDIDIKGLYIRNAPLAVYPLEEKSRIKHISESSGDEGGDFASIEDIGNLKDGGSITLYILENVQGRLLPDNEECADKVPENISGTDPSFLTYICLEAGTQSMNNSCGKVLYRSYLGEDNCSDFSIIRNTARSLTMRIYNTDVDDDNWRITPEDPIRIFTPSINICLRGYLDNGGLWCPKVEMEIGDCEQIIKYIGDFRENTSVSLTATAVHNTDLKQIIAAMYGDLIRHVISYDLRQDYSSVCERYSFLEEDCPVFTFDDQAQGDTRNLRALIDLSYFSSNCYSYMDAKNSRKSTFYEEKGADIDILIDIDFPDETIDRIKEIYGKSIPNLFNVVEDWREGFPFDHPSWSMGKTSLMNATSVEVRVNGVTLPVS